MVIGRAARTGDARNSEAATAKTALIAAIVLNLDAAVRRPAFAVTVSRGGRGEGETQRFLELDAN